MLAETGKACIIHPTGTGKSLIGFQLAADNPDKKVLWLSPSEYIFRTQLENWREVGGPELLNLTFLTYAKLILLSDEELQALTPQIIVLDEFHRAGAECWQNGVSRLLTLYPPTAADGARNPYSAESDVAASTDNAFRAMPPAPQALSDEDSPVNDPHPPFSAESNVPARADGPFRATPPAPQEGTCGAPIPYFKNPCISLSPML